MTRPKPVCPACGSRKAVAFDRENPESMRWGFGSPSDTPEPEEPSTGHAPAWACRECATHFGHADRPNARLPGRSSAEWVALIETMLPGPVRVDGNTLTAGAPALVVVRVTDAAIEISEAAIRWQGHSPTPQPLAFATARLSTPASRIAALILAAWSKRLSRYRWCPRCKQVTQPEHMLTATGRVCHGCATAHLGVLF